MQKMKFMGYLGIKVSISQREAIISLADSEEISMAEAARRLLDVGINSLDIETNGGRPSDRL
jgi:hypothetical protein